MAVKPILSCVVDTHPRFLMQAWIWLVSAHLVGAFNDCDVVIHHVGTSPKVLKDAAARFGARILVIEAFGEENAARYCNKLQSHEPILATKTSAAILTDVDLFFFASPAECVDPDYVRAKIVDHPNPPEEIMTDLFEALGLTDLNFDGIPTFCQDSRTHKMNCNGGLYICPIESLEILAPIWQDYSKRCLARENILKNFLFHADQLGFTMSMIETGLPFKSLGAEWNYPTHFPAKDHDKVHVDEIKILHYHKMLSGDGLLERSGIPKIDHYIDRANASLEPFMTCPEFKSIQRQFAKSLS